MKRNAYLRKKVFERDAGICAVCGQFDPKWEADHRHELWAKGPDRLENMADALPSPPPRQDEREHDRARQD
jgi:5-methylcytosine-specific restriction endonuclease McrA